MACLKESGTGKIHFLHRVTTLGSSPDCGVRIKGEGVAEEHARIIFEEERFRIEIAGAGLALSLNGKKIKKESLSEGDRIGVGGIEFAFSLFSPAQPREASEAKAAAFNALHGMSVALLSSEGLPRLLEALLDKVVTYSRADKGFIAFREGEAFTVRYVKNLVDKDVPAASEMSRSLLKEVAQTRRPLLVSDATADTAFGMAQSIVNLKLKSVMAAPLVVGNEVLGCLYLGSERISNLFDQEDLEAVTIFAAQASLLIKNLLQIENLKGENKRLKTLVSGTLIYQSTEMENLLRRVQKVAEAGISALILGETGTGKELVAREIHRLSPRREGPFITVNCSAIPENLVESELFGHKKGAFTGAVSDAKGKFEAAHGGTLFLDEIGDLNPGSQAKLLRVLETGEVELVGDTVTRKVDVRVVAATNKDLKAGSAEGGFRQDLYFRLCGAELKLPPLRERGLDIVYIARAVLKESAPGKSFSKAAEAALLAYGWPGNVRELKNRVIRAAALCAGAEISPVDLELGEGAESPLLPFAEARERFSKDYLRQVLLLNQGNKTKTAKDLGIDVRTIYRYLEEKEE